MSHDTQDRVIAGVDAVGERTEAVELAIAEAQRLGASLTIVHAVSATPPVSYPVGPWLTGFQEAVDELRHRLDGLADGIRADHPDLEVRSVVETGGAASVLIDMSLTAKLIVLGCRGLGGFAELLLGSVSSQVAAHARCPVIVVRPHGDAPAPSADAPVLVGVDGSPANAPAVGFAFNEAAARRVRLVVLHYWAPSASLNFVGEYDQAALDRDEIAAERLVAEAIAPWVEKYPDLTVETRVTLQPYAEEFLLTASAEAQLVVVGSRGRGGFAGLLLGSVSQALLHHAHCPVAVIR